MILPLDTIREEMDVGIRNTMVLLGIAVLLGIGCLAVAMGQMRSGARRLGEQVEVRTAALNQSETDKSELLQLRSHLERQVEERTAELSEKAESEASLAALSSRLQGGLTPKQIAHEAMAAIIESTEAPSGALYVLEGDGRLHRRAEHALPPEATAQNVFSLSSGSIGQAAKDRKMLIRDPGDQQWSITFGLGRTPPRSIVTCPLVANDSLAGVVELYLLTEFNGTQSQWLTKASQTVASALRLAQEGSEKDRADEQTRLILESTPDCMVITNDRGEIVFVNSVSEKTFGYDRNDLIGHPVTDLIPERYHGSHGANVAGFVANPHVREMGAGLDLFALKNDGSEFPVQISLSPVESDEGLLIVAAVRDISEMKAEQAHFGNSHVRRSKAPHSSSSQIETVRSSM